MNAQYTTNQPIEVAMAEIPENAFNMEDLYKWFELRKQLEATKPLAVQEMFLRKKIAAALFPNPSEGTNTYELNDGTGYVVKYGHTIERKIDEGALAAMSEIFKENGISKDSLVRLKPELEKKAYNKLTDEQRHIFDQALTIKPGSITLEIVLPAKNKVAE